MKRSAAMKTKRRRRRDVSDLADRLRLEAEHLDSSYDDADTDLLREAADALEAAGPIVEAARAFAAAYEDDELYTYGDLYTDAQEVAYRTFIATAGALVAAVRPITKPEETRPDA